MAASTAQPQSKSAKKKAAKAIERTDSPAPSTTSGAAQNGGEDGSYESPYIKELQKNIRNVNKKITNASKTDSLLAQHPGKSLDQLVQERILNADQKAQILKKPALEAQRSQFEEQLAQYLKVDEQYKTRAAADKAEWEKALEKAKADAAAEAKGTFDKALHGNLLLLSQFLRLAAYRREEAADPESDESQAIEGVLMAIYTGDESAVSSMLKLVQGSSDQILSVPGEQLETTYSRVKTIAEEFKPPYEGEAPPAEAPTEAPVETAAAEPEVAKEVGTDPTVANATTTEIEAGDATALNGQHAAVESVNSSIANLQVSDNAANAVAESHWDNNNEASLSQEWVQVPRDPKETETGLTATPAAVANTQSWADDHPEQTEPAAPAAPADANDGFHQVQRNRPRNEGGNHRGRGQGNWRGRGGRGDGRGRGRGNRGAGGPRGPRRGDES
ncbi:hypothetical protein ACRE_069170 [Hapsidospora chrysogenum ATCC 11550]|uniref:YAG7-like dimerisation domain-containing protein n=1 Tax=Hapsidospora chrysogenum (strain ATCC 11550 / CBS 779.69 / DSM 880 / IAM 14645 / JCM 23072 / IMI 49137) TaxID=857340 RepID=A0A086SZ34_HAPC1|nr:hypothetical protein ACRE_069170 [Hapsidospora chrysogenum ATCC 11550]